MGRDDIYPVRTSKVGCVLHYVIAYLGLDIYIYIYIYHPDPWHAPVAATTVLSTPDDGRRKLPKHVE